MLAHGQQGWLVRLYAVLTASIVLLHAACHRGVAGLRPDLLSVWGTYVW